jgi:hypothetical protein
VRCRFLSVAGDPCLEVSVTEPELSADYDNGEGVVRSVFQAVESRAAHVEELHGLRDAEEAIIERDWEVCEGIDSLRRRFQRGHGERSGGGLAGLGC